MIRTTIVFAALVAALSASTAYAQEVTPGFEPQTSLPKVSLPQRTNTVPKTPTLAKPAAEASTSIQRSGGTQTTTDLKKAPEGALKAAAAATQVPSPAASTTPSAKTENKYRAGMMLYGDAKAYDGHSLLVGGNPVRLNGIEAPGMKQLCYTAQGTAWRCGLKAYERLAALVNGKKVRCVVNAPAGHGAAATCSASQTKDVASLLVAEGLAVPNRQSAGAYAGEVGRASATKSGMWIGGFTDPAKWRLQNK
nr:thermonuclease family protein [Neorhizobium tomejilense]